MKALSLYKLYVQTVLCHVDKNILENTLCNIFKDGNFKINTAESINRHFIIATFFKGVKEFYPKHESRGMPSAQKISKVLTSVSKSLFGLYVSGKFKEQCLNLNILIFLYANRMRDGALSNTCSNLILHSIRDLGGLQGYPKVHLKLCDHSFMFDAVNSKSHICIFDADPCIIRNCLFLDSFFGEIGVSWMCIWKNFFINFSRADEKTFNVEKIKILETILEFSPYDKNFYDQRHYSPLTIYHTFSEALGPYGYTKKINYEDFFSYHFTKTFFDFCRKFGFDIISQPQIVYDMFRYHFEYNAARYLFERGFDFKKPFIDLAGSENSVILWNLIDGRLDKKGVTFQDEFGDFLTFKDFYNKFESQRTKEALENELKIEPIVRVKRRM